MFEQVKEKPLNQVLRVFGRIASMPDKFIQRIPVNLAEIGESFFGTGRPALRGNEHDTPPSGLKLLGAAADFPPRQPGRFALPRSFGVRFHGCRVATRCGTLTSLVTTPAPCLFFWL